MCFLTRYLLCLVSTLFTEEKTLLTFFPSSCLGISFCVVFYVLVLFDKMV